MPINGLTGRVRTPRQAKIRLGYTKKGRGGEYPADTDVFVARGGDGVSQGILEAYGAKRIPDAAEEVWSLGRSLRLMLPWEFDKLHDGREVALELLNRSWGATRLRCSGTGGDQPGEAVCRDPAYLERIVRETAVEAQEVRDGQWRVRCLGPECPMWHTRRSDRDKLPGCHREMRFQAILLHPAADPESQDYMRWLAFIEVASGSWNGAIDVQSGLQMLRTVAGRTTLVPFHLRRVARSILRDGQRLVKATLMVDFDADEAQRFGLGPPARALLRPAVRRELLELAAAEARFDSVADIQPRPADQVPAPAAEPPRPRLPRPARAMALPAGDRDQALEEAGVAQPESVSVRIGAMPTDEGARPEEAPRLLSQAERDELKRLCGGEPGRPDTLSRFRELTAAAYRELGVPDEGGWMPWAGGSVLLKLLTTRHRRWIEGQIEAQPKPEAPPSVDPEALDPDDIEALDEWMEAS